EDDAAAIGLAVVPGGALRRLPVALEHPVSELAAHREDAPEETAVAQHLELQEARQEQLVLHHAVLDAGRLRLLRQRHGAVEVVGDGLLAIDVLAGVDRLAQQAGAHLRGAGVEEDGVLGVGERRVEVGAPAGDVVLLGEPLDLVAVATDDDDVRHQPGAVGEHRATLVTDGEDGAHQVLVVAHASGDAVHDDADASLNHPDFLRFTYNCLVTCLQGHARLRQARAGAVYHPSSSVTPINPRNNMIMRSKAAALSLPPSHCPAGMNRATGASANSPCRYHSGRITPLPASASNCTTANSRNIADTA